MTTAMYALVERFTPAEQAAIRDYLESTIAILQSETAKLRDSGTA